MVGLVDFEVLGELGRGGYGRVFRVRRRGGAVDGGVEYALKCLKLDSKNKKKKKNRRLVDHVNAEAAILTQVQHPFVVSLWYMFRTARLLCFAMEFVPGGDLHSKLLTRHTLPEEEARFYLTEVILGVEYLHSIGVVFRDLKPENVLLDEGCGHVKLCDFGLSRFLKEEEDDVTPTSGGGGRLWSLCGTDDYMSPEMIRGEGGHSFGVDWWAVGVLFYDMLCGGSPFASPPHETSRALRVYRTRWRVTHAQHRFPHGIDVSCLAARLIEALLKKEESERLGSPGRMRVRDHPYFRDTDWDAFLRRDVVPPPPQTTTTKTTAPAAANKQGGRGRGSCWFRLGAAGEELTWQPSSSCSSADDEEAPPGGNECCACDVGQEEDTNNVVFSKFDWVSPELLRQYRDVNYRTIEEFSRDSHEFDEEQNRNSGTAVGVIKRPATTVVDGGGRQMSSSSVVEMRWVGLVSGQVDYASVGPGTFEGQVGSGGDETSSDELTTNDYNNYSLFGGRPGVWNGGVREVLNSASSLAVVLNC